MSIIRSRSVTNADLNNTSDKKIMGAFEDTNLVTRIPTNIEHLYECLDIEENKCVYCGNDGNSTDEIIPCMFRGRYNPNGGHINMVNSCSRCNSSKSNKRLSNFIDWINKGGHSNKDLCIPILNRKKIIDWYIENHKYLQADNPIIIDTIEKSHRENMEYIKSRETLVQGIKDSYPPHESNKELVIEEECIAIKNAKKTGFTADKKYIDYFKNNEDDVICDGLRPARPGAEGWVRDIKYFPDRTLFRHKISNNCQGRSSWVGRWDTNKNQLVRSTEGGKEYKYVGKSPLNKFAEDHKISNGKSTKNVNAWKECEYKTEDMSQWESTYKIVYPPSP